MRFCSPRRRRMGFRTRIPPSGPLALEQELSLKGSGQDRPKARGQERHSGVDSDGHIPEAATRATSRDQKASRLRRQSEHPHRGQPDGKLAGLLMLAARVVLRHQSLRRGVHASTPNPASGCRAPLWAPPRRGHSSHVRAGKQSRVAQQTRRCEPTWHAGYAGVRRQGLGWRAGWRPRSRVPAAPPRWMSSAVAQPAVASSSRHGQSVRGPWARQFVSVNVNDFSPRTPAGGRVASRL
ncbi:hypothetical protein CDD83_3397 [Cordyceps sp. RAO-2017]|nr:hypothetical protein CDD83_3397 [Cordyceps sp. RAO-2017]